MEDQTNFLHGKGLSADLIGDLEDKALELNIEEGKWVRGSFLHLIFVNRLSR